MNEGIIKQINKYNFIIGPAYVLLSLAFWSFPKTLGVALGAAIMMLNFYLMVYLIRKAFHRGKIDPVPFVFYLLKILFLFAAVFFIFKLEFVDKIFFLAGTSALLVSLILAGLSYKRVENNA